jgi:3-methyladenine DNA glycosylase Tag
LIAFKTIRARAEKRKGGAEALARLLPPKPDPKALSKHRDDRVLAEMTKRVFSAGFAWSVIESKWPGFEEAFSVSSRRGSHPRRTSFGIS